MTGFFSPFMLHRKMCRILRRRDRPTAHPRHMEYASQFAAQTTRDTIRRRRQVTKLPRPFPQYPPLSQRYRFLRMRCCVLALPMPFTGQGALGLRCDRGRMTSGMSSFLAGRHSQAFFASALCRSNAVTCILNMNRISPVIFQGASVTFEILIQSSRQQLISL